MKRLTIIVSTVLFILGMGTTTFAKVGDKEVDVSGVYGLERAEDFGGTFGFNIGGGYEFMDNIQARVDIAYLSRNNLENRRIPITFSGRYYFPGGRNLKPYAQAGLELSFDKFGKAETGNVVDGTSIKSSASETNVGLTPGVGIEFAITPRISIVADAMYHIIKDDYFTLQSGIVLRF